jgi:CheY-like chemotaxis protein
VLAFRSKRTLVVDDNASAREILAGMLHEFGMHCETAANGALALEQLQAAQQAGQPFELVLLDWRMPVLNGLETLARLPQAGLSPLPAVIMITSHAREDALQSAGDDGLRPKAILTKPVTGSTLLEAISEALGHEVLVVNRVHQKADAQREHMQALRGSRLLLVEDNDMNQELALELLGQAGIEVVLANHGQEALDILSQDARFDGILMDCQMPVMDGYTAARRIHADPALSHLPIVAMTANAMSGDREKVMDAGMLDHIPKPLDVESMFATLARYMVRHDRDREAIAAPVSISAVPDTIAGLSALPGIDIAAGLSVTMNNQSLYRRLMLRFRDGQRDFQRLFDEARHGDDPTAPERVAHTLKGTAGNIGARGVYDAADLLEAACRNGRPADELQAALDRVLAELAPVIQGLDTIEAPAEAPQNDTPLPSVLSAMGHLRALLEACDTDASDLVDELLHDVRGTALERDLIAVARAVADYDFDTAIACLDPVLAAHESTSA